MKERVKFFLIGLKTEQFATFEENLSKTKKIGLNTNLRFRINKEAQQIGVFATFTFEQTKKTIVKIEVSCHFKIAPESWGGLISENSIVFPKDFATHLAVLTVGTARGVLHSKTVDTALNKYFLPTIDVTQLVKEDVALPLN